jgi:hypothetical protein
MARKDTQQDQPPSPVLPPPNVLNSLTPAQRELVEQRAAAMIQSRPVEVKKGLDIG